jgi:methionyl-tRNA formyltransferase
MVRVVFMGTPAFAVPSLDALAALGQVGTRPLQVVGVFTQPDRPSGRGNRLVASPVKARAQELGIPVYQPERLRRPEGMALLEAAAPDLIVVAAYAQILSQRVLDLPRHGALNVHASLLPRYRGAAPIQAAILDGVEETGVSIMLMEAGLDTGPVLSQVRVGVDPLDTAGTLAGKLAPAGARLLAETVPGWIAGSVIATPQDETLATMTRPLKREDEELDWTRPAAYLARQVRAMQPAPGTFTFLGDRLLKVLAASVEPAPAATGAKPGALLTAHGEPVVVTGQDGLRLQVVQPAGKRAMTGADWLRGAQAGPGTILGREV